ncbi:putative phage abortive infection protein [Agitococcus lubricus]|uniref:Putative phage abortive infection protein n=1 Tax=Agitococcus lubricus TaxID=1077255 RepID=A0A2T5ISJ4_9GAMM|nr:putative phage abortive infection protein [Agitococcus lubricus]PTQ86800.1 putative phage abortive infection protein [Agitococcus lubricus]
MCFLYWFFSVLDFLKVLTKNIKEILLFFLRKTFFRLNNFISDIFISNIIGNEKDESIAKETKNISKILIGIVLLAFSIMVVVFLIDFLNPPLQDNLVAECQNKCSPKNVIDTENKVDLGPFGDFFGGMLNPIFTFLTFFGIVITIVMQRVELKLTRDEYSKTNQEIKRQTIENQFFNLIDLHNKICAELLLPAKNISQEVLMGKSSITNNKKIYDIYQNTHKDQYIGRQVFSELYDILRFSDSGMNVSVKVFIGRYKKIQNSHNYIFGHYFRNLFQILKFIAEMELDEEKKYKYAKIIRAQMSTMELAILLINCTENMVDKGEFRNLLVKFSFLKHLGLDLKKDGKNEIVRLKGVSSDFISINVLKYFLDLDNTCDDKKLGAFGNSESVRGIASIIGWIKP